MQALTLERWVPPGTDTADPSSHADDTDEVPYAFTWTDTGDPAELVPYAFVWEGAEQDAAGPNAKNIASGAGTGAAIGGAVGTIFPGIGTALGAGIGGAVGAIGGFVSGLFGGKKKRRRKPRKKPTPKWVVAVLEDARRGLLEVPPNPSKSIDAVLVVSGQMTRDAYMLAKQTGQLPSQKFDQNRSAAMVKGGLIDKKVGRRIAASLTGMSAGEKALVSAAIPLGSSKLVLGALKKIRSAVTSAHAQPAAETKFSPEALRQLAQKLAEDGEQAPSWSDAPSSPDAPPAYAPEESWPEQPVAQPGESYADDYEQDAYDTSGPDVVAREPTIDDLPRPVWHVSPPELPRHMFVRLLQLMPDLAKLPKNMLRAIAGRGPRAQDTAGVDPVMREYLMLPGETFAGIARNLTGDPNRAVELEAANPNRNPLRMRVNIPPGWLDYTPLLLNSASDTGAPKAPEKAQPPRKTAPAPKAKRATKDGPRPNITKRQIEVRAGDWPMKIAKRTGAAAVDPQWWKTLKSVNPHKAVASDGNWETLFAGERLNYPDTWPAHPEAKPSAAVTSERVTTAPETPIQPDDPLGQDPPAPAPSPAPKRVGKDGPRPAITKRVIEVLRDDWPEKIARRVGATEADPQWWRTLKSVNPHKAVASNGNWESLFAGEKLNYPDTWPASLEAKPAPGIPTDPVTPPPPATPDPKPPAQPPPGVPELPSTPPPVPTGGTADRAIIAWAQSILVQWTMENPKVADPSDFGNVFMADVNGVMTERTKACLSSFQSWRNALSQSSRLRTDGVLDEDTKSSLNAYRLEALSRPIPSNPELPGGQTAPQTPPGGGSQVPPGTPIPAPPQAPAPAPPPPAPAPSTREASGKDDDAAMLVIGGTMLSLLMR
ncbi:MAG: hypothetical protein HUU26_03435 [Gemmatimonadaceae bacterium]|nr:hypothetical protein [Gemmatimonadaceae bacterium]